MDGTRPCLPLISPQAARLTPELDQGAVIVRRPVAGGGACLSGMSTYCVRGARCPAGAEAGEVCLRAHGSHRSHGEHTTVGSRPSFYSERGVN